MLFFLNLIPPIFVVYDLWRLYTTPGFYYGFALALTGIMWGFVFQHDYRWLRWRLAQRRLAQVDARRAGEHRARVEAVQRERAAYKLGVKLQRRAEYLGILPQVMAIVEAYGMRATRAFVDGLEPHVGLLYDARQLGVLDLVLIKLASGEVVAARQIIIANRARVAILARASGLGITDTVTARLDAGDADEARSIIDDAIHRAERVAVIVHLAARVGAAISTDRATLSPLLDDVKVARSDHDFRKAVYTLERILDVVEDEGRTVAPHDRV